MPTPNSSNNTHLVQLGRYRIVREIARSNDIVYEAIDPTINRKVAIKELNLPASATGPTRDERLERFYREAKAAGSLNHRNIVTIYEIGQDRNRHYIAMEYLNGQSVREHLQMHGALAIKLCLQIAMDLCDALSHAHSQGIIHRDIKPDNVHLVAPSNTAKLTDFGIARLQEEPALTSTGQVFGTPSYMSPEQLMGRTVDQRTDIFSLGVLLYECLAGKKPFQGDTIVSVTYAILNSPVTYPTSMPAGITGILRRAMAKDPDQRYPNALAMLADLRAESAFAGSAYPYPSAAQPTPAIKTGQPVTVSVTSQPASESEPTEMATADQTLLASEKTELATVTQPTQTTVPPLTDYTTGRQVTQPTAPYTPTDRVSPTYYSRKTNDINWSFIGAASLAAVLVLVVFTLVFATLNQRHLMNARAAATDKYNSGSLALDNDDYDTAIKDYYAALKLAPPGDSIEEETRRGLALAFIMQGDKRDPATAVFSYREATHYDQAEPIAHFKLAMVLTDNKEAVKEYQAAIDRDPTGATGQSARKNASELYYKMGSEEADSHDNEHAREDLNKVISLSPTDPIADQARQKLTSAGL